jgi:hypothetical protein
MIHVVGKNTESNDELLDKEHQLTKVKFEEILQKCKPAGNITCTLNYNITGGKIFNKITNLADKLEDSIIVLSTHGESGFEELSLEEIHTK